jgi:aspartate/methionine/tyrosine aminotransferase
MNIAPFKLERYFARYEFTAPYLLCASDCEAVSLDELLALDPDLGRKLHALRLGYTQATGAPELRAAVAKLYESVPADEVLLHAGSSEAIFSFMNCTLAAGDHVIVQSPCYQSHYEVARAIGCDVTQWVGDERNGWSLDPALLERSIRPNTKAVMLTAPHNPTGYLMTHQTQSAIIDIVRRRGLWLFSDEIFRFLEHDQAQRLPAAADVYERAISVGGLSKSFGLAGVRVGWIATRDHAVCDAMTRFKDYLSLCNGATDEVLAGVALEHREVLHRRSIDIIHANLGIFTDFLARHGHLFSWQRPYAGSIGLVRYAGSEGSARFCDDVVTRSGVLLLPSAQLDFGDEHFRVGLGRRNAPECISRFERSLSRDGATISPRRGS